MEDLDVLDDGDVRARDRGDAARLRRPGERARDRARPRDNPGARRRRRSRPWRASTPTGGAAFSCARWPGAGGSTRTPRTTTSSRPTSSRGDTHRLTQAALETLAVIAYTQPTTREGVRSVRGVNSDSAHLLARRQGAGARAGQARGWRHPLRHHAGRFWRSSGCAASRTCRRWRTSRPDEQTRQLIRDRLSGQRTQSTFDELDEGRGEDADAPGRRRRRRGRRHR